MTAPRRILGLDAGERRIGVAISDPDASFALPLRSVIVDGTEFDALEAFIHGEDVGEFVVGLPLSLSGESSAQTERARAFARRLEERFGLPVHLWDERLSTQEALRHTEREDRRSGRRGRGRQTPAADTDAIAASIILQAYLDARRFESI
ncbi:MAG TPA: Holliday junction resolvase RuvX [Dehalococcoidia bacterium]|nr:Holliday junction resolvase RuvX [Dehalococcoidia bacterium]